MFLPDDPQQIDTVVLAAFQPYVQDDEVRLPGADRRQRTRAVSGGAGLVTLGAEDAADQHPDVRLVIDDQNVTRHRPSSRPSSPFLEPRRPSRTVHRPPCPPRTVGPTHTHHPT